jgi:hypothetical protein
VRRRRASFDRIADGAASARPRLDILLDALIGALVVTTGTLVEVLLDTPGLIGIIIEPAKVLAITILILAFLRIAGAFEILLRCSTHAQLPGQLEIPVDDAGHGGLVEALFERRQFQGQRTGRSEHGLAGRRLHVEEHVVHFQYRSCRPAHIAAVAMNVAFGCMGRGLLANT